MKNIIINFLNIAIFSFFTFLSHGQPVSVNKAETIAKNHYYIFANISEKFMYDDISFSEHFTLGEDQESFFHIFNVSDNNGYVIVSADSRYHPIIGYSTKGSFDPQNQAPSFIAYMNLHKNELSYLINNDVYANEKVKQEWAYLQEKSSLTNIKTEGVEPLLTTNWSQGCGWNAYCPEDSLGACGRARVGCVAVAQAQILKYWNFPEQGIGEHSYSHSTYGELSANFGETTYNWDNMPNNNPNDDIAKLMYHVGVSVNMNYGPTASAAYSHMVVPSLIDFFGYTIWTDFIDLNHQGSPQVFSEIIDELENFRPLYYAGTPPFGVGHALVLDGYQHNSEANVYFFHFNYGWGGSNNGYYRLFSGSSYMHNPNTLIRYIIPSDCEDFELPYLEDFETETVHCWTGLNEEMGRWELNSEQNFTDGGNYSAHYRCLASVGCNEDSYFISPQIIIPENPQNSIELSFRSLNLCPSFYGSSKNRVHISTDNGVSFEEIWVAQAEDVVDSWIKTKIIIDEYAGDTINVVFSRDGAQGSYVHNWYIDDIKIDYKQHDPPLLTTLSVQNISETSAECMSIVDESGDSSLSLKGVVWASFDNPCLDNNEGFTEDGSDAGAFQSFLNDLSPNTTYYVRAYAQNDQKTAYGNQLSFFTAVEDFVCGESIVTDIDGNDYNTVLIGTQCWLSENLKTTRHSNGDRIENPKCVVNFALQEWSGINHGAYIWINYSYSNKDTYGALYNWYAVEDDRGLCPDGWHIPSSNEWFALERYTNIVEEDHVHVLGTWGDWYGYKGAEKLAGNSSMWNDGKLKNSSDFGNTGFNAIPSGIFWYYGTVGMGHIIGEDAYFWSSSRAGPGPYYRRLHYDTTNIEIRAGFRNSGKSVRCVRSKPSFVTRNVVQTDINTAEGGVIFTNTTDAEVESIGLVWGTSEKPTIEDNSGIYNNGSEISNFDYTFTDFAPSEKYYTRAYIIYSNGMTYYSNQVPFMLLPQVKSCPEHETVTDIEGNIYNTVLIGDQCWMTENLRTATHPKGYPVEMLCRYPYQCNDTTFLKKYGGLYTWESAVYGEAAGTSGSAKVQGICPDGWYLPGDEDWNNLQQYLINAGYNYKFKSEGNHFAQSLASDQGIWRPYASYNPVDPIPGSPAWDSNANNRTGFNAIDTYSRSSSGEWRNLRKQTLFWTSTAQNITDARYRKIYYSSDSLVAGYKNKLAALSVRCMKDLSVGIPNQNSKTESFINIFPNPGDGVFTIEWNENHQHSKVLIEVFNNLGNRIYMDNIFISGYHTIDISQQPEGIYYIKLTDGNKSSYQKLIKKE